MTKRSKLRIIQTSLLCMFCLGIVATTYLTDRLIAQQLLPSKPAVQVSVNTIKAD